MSTPATPITFVTGNAGKLRELESIASGKLDFTARKLSLDEIQSLDLREIVTHKLRQAYAEVQAPVIVEDVSAVLASLNGLPGPFVKFFNQQLGSGALHILALGKEDAVMITCLAGYYDGHDMLFAEGIMAGHVTAPRGENGFGFDPVVVPDEQPDLTCPGRTVAEMTPDEKNIVSHRAKAMRSLIARLA